MQAAGAPNGPNLPVLSCDRIQALTRLETPKAAGPTWKHWQGRSSRQAVVGT